MLIAKYKLLLGIGLISVALLSTVVHAVSSTIVISEVAPGSTEGASREFVELYNNTADNIDVSKWVVEYKSAIGKTWSKKATLDTHLINSHSYLVVSTEATDDTKLTSGMAQTGGNIRLLNDKKAVVDQFAWGDGDAAEQQASLAVTASQSLARGLDESGSVLADTDNNQADFHVSLAQTPGQSPAAEPETPGPTPDSNPGDIRVSLSELLPDPVSPQTDSKDEFIELYNEDSAEANISGWSLRDKSGHTYNIKDVIIPAHSFCILKSGTTKISLNNDGDEISLISVDGTVVDSSPNYGASKAGLSWGLVDGIWAWTQVPTPGASNAAVLVEASKTAATTRKATVAKVSKPKVATTKKVAVAKKSKLAKPASAAAAPTSLTSVQSPKGSPMWSWLLIALGVGTIGYGAYAYKPEITHFVHKLRTKLSTR